MTVLQQLLAYLNDCGELPDLLGADLRYTNLRDADLRYTNLRDADLLGANLRGADLLGAYLLGADLRDADLRDADLRDADPRDAYLHDADLRDAYLRYTNLLGANLRGANLSGANLSGAKIERPRLSDLFEKDEFGFIVYKTFGDYYSPSKEWKIEPGSFITENVESTITLECGCGVNVATLEWIEQEFEMRRVEIWRCRIRFEDLDLVIVPLGTNGKVRCGRLELLEKL